MNKSKYAFYMLAINLIFSQDKGKKFYDNKEYDEARKYYQSIVEQRKNDKNAYFGIGASAYQENDLNLAENSFIKSIDKENKDLSSKSYFNLGRIYQDKGVLDSSLAFYKRSIELNPNDIDAKINYELLKNTIAKQEKQKSNDKSDESSIKNKDQDNQDNKDNNEHNKNNQSSKNQSNKNKEDSENDKNNDLANNDKKKDGDNDNTKSDDQINNKESDLNSEDIESLNGNNVSNTNENKEEKIRQAEALLNALKEQEQINQKQKILKTRLFKFDKDW